MTMQELLKTKMLILEDEKDAVEDLLDELAMICADEPASLEELFRGPSNKVRYRINNPMEDYD